MGINNNAEKIEIKRAYRKLAKKYHPDMNKDSNAEAKFIEISDAYQILYNDTTRQEYDRMLVNKQRDKDLKYQYNKQNRSHNTYTYQTYNQPRSSYYHRPSYKEPEVFTKAEYDKRQAERYKEAQRKKEESYEREFDGEKGSFKHFTFTLQKNKFLFQKKSKMLISWFLFLFTAFIVLFFIYKSSQVFIEKGFTFDAVLEITFVGAIMAFLFYVLISAFIIISALSSLLLIVNIIAIGVYIKHLTGLSEIAGSNYKILFGLVISSIVFAFLTGFGKMLIED